jgi:hypothetical protein
LFFAIFLQELMVRCVKDILDYPDLHDVHLWAAPLIGRAHLFTAYVVICELEQTFWANTSCLDKDESTLNNVRNMKSNRSTPEEKQMS